LHQPVSGDAAALRPSAHSAGRCRSASDWAPEADHLTQRGPRRLLWICPSRRERL